MKRFDMDSVLSLLAVMICFLIYFKTGAGGRFWLIALIGCAAASICSAVSARIRRELRRRKRKLAEAKRRLEMKYDDFSELGRDELVRSGFVDPFDIKIA